VLTAYEFSTTALLSKRKLFDAIKGNRWRRAEVFGSGRHPLQQSARRRRAESLNPGISLMHT
jgi:hypothetical protein